MSANDISNLMPSLSIKRRLKTKYEMQQDFFEKAYFAKLKINNEEPFLDLSKHGNGLYKSLKTVVIFQKLINAAYPDQSNIPSITLAACSCIGRST